MKRLWSPALFVCCLPGVGLAYKVLSSQEPEQLNQTLEHEGPVPLYAQLAAAIPLVCQNLTNFT
ncbi:unnamed protein product, partial [Symbiodinium pilosum]